MVQFLTKTRLALNARGGKEVGIEDLVKRVVKKRFKMFFRWNEGILEQQWDPVKSPELHELQK